MVDKETKKANALKNPAFVKNIGGYKDKKFASAAGKKGGVAAGKSIRARKTLKEALLDLLSEGDNQENMNRALFSKALDGDTKAFEIIRDTIGEKAADKIEGGVTFLDLVKDKS